MKITKEIFCIIVLICCLLLNKVESIKKQNSKKNIKVNYNKFTTVTRSDNDNIVNICPDTNVMKAKY